MATVELRGKSFSIKKTLGKGAFGQVYKVKDTQSREFALKCIECTPQFDFQRALGEIRTLKRLSHPNVLKIHLADVKSGSRIGTWVYILTEFCEGGNLNQRLNRPSNRATEYKWITQLADALTYLHSRSKPIAHRDLKPDNVLLTASDDLKLADFGLAREFVSMKVPFIEGRTWIHQYMTYMNTMAGTPYFVAPEVFRGHYTLKADVFSLGAIFYTILERSHSVSHRGGSKYFGAFLDDGSSLVEAMLNGDVNASVSFTRRIDQDRVSKKLRQIIWNALKYDSNSRPTAQEVYNDIQAVMRVSVSRLDSPVEVDRRPQWIAPVAVLGVAFAATTAVVVGILRNVISQ